MPVATKVDQVMCKPVENGSVENDYRECARQPSPFTHCEKIIGVEQGKCPKTAFVKKCPYLARMMSFTSVNIYDAAHPSLQMAF